MPLPVAEWLDEAGDDVGRPCAPALWPLAAPLLPFARCLPVVPETALDVLCVVAPCPWWRLAGAAGCWSPLLRCLTSATAAPTVPPGRAAATSTLAAPALPVAATPAITPPPVVAVAAVPAAAEPPSAPVIVAAFSPAVGTTGSRSASASRCFLVAS